MNKTETIYEFAKMLRNHDWYFMMSDDHSVYLKGSENADKIDDFISNVNDPELLPILSDMYRIAREEHQISM